MMNDQRQAQVEHFARLLTQGEHERTHNYLWTDPTTGEKHDITDEVMIAAGPESDAETEARVLQRERNVPRRLERELESLCFRELAWADQYIGGQRYWAAEPGDDEPGDELVFERDDGKRFLVEIQVTVRPE